MLDLKSLFKGIFHISVCAILSVSGLFSTANAKETPSLESAFDTTTVQFTTSSDAVNVPVEWKYTNHTDIPMFIERFDVSCGCLSTQSKLDTTGVEPGKAGVIQANFTPGGHRGLVRKSIHVRFVGYDKPVELIAEATIPSSVEISQRELIWTPSDKAKPQSIEVKSGSGDEFHITALLGVSENLFTISQETLTPNKHFRIHITPVGIPKEGINCLQIRTDSKDPRDQVLAVFLRAENAAPSDQPSTAATQPVSVKITK